MSAGGCLRLRIGRAAKSFRKNRRNDSASGTISSFERNTSLIAAANSSARAPSPSDWRSRASTSMRCPASPAPHPRSPAPSPFAPTSPGSAISPTCKRCRGQARRSNRRRRSWNCAELQCERQLLPTRRPPQNRRCPAPSLHRPACEDVPIAVHRRRTLVLEVRPPLQKIAPRRAPDGFDHAPALSSIEPVRFMQERDVLDAQLRRMPKERLGTAERRVCDDRPG